MNIDAKHVINRVNNYYVILSLGLSVGNAHALMRFCNLNKSLVCLQSERRTLYQNSGLLNFFIILLSYMQEKIFGFSYINHMLFYRIIHTYISIYHRNMTQQLIFSKPCKIYRSRVYVNYCAILTSSQETKYKLYLQADHTNKQLSGRQLFEIRTTQHVIFISGLFF